MRKREGELRFPEGFLFGTATAGHQIEGDNVNSDWWHWEKSGKLPVKSGRAVNSWELWKEDLDLAKNLGTNAYRFSLEWARIEPAEGKFEPSALKHYEEEIVYLHRLGMQAMLTLWHFTLPEWFAKKGGFSRRENLWYFERFIKFVLANLTEPPDYWITLNEPSNVYVGGSYIYGLCPPGKRDVWSTVSVFFNLAEPHRVAYGLIHARYPEAKVSAAINMMCFENFDRNPLLSVLAWAGDLFFNRLFLRRIVGFMDFVGVNYYYVHETRWRDLLPRALTRRIIKEIQLGERFDIAWPVYPQGIYKIVMSLKKYGLPIIITENGLADDRSGKREAFISDTLEWLRQAMGDGAEVSGYFYWTLMDNFEWTSGYEPKYGLYSVEPKTFKRILKPSGKYYRKICRDKALIVGEG